MITWKPLSHTSHSERRRFHVYSEKYTLALGSSTKLHSNARPETEPRTLEVSKPKRKTARTTVIGSRRFTVCSVCLCSQVFGEWYSLDYDDSILIARRLSC